MKMYVGNLSFQTTKQELQDLFSQHGQVTDVHLPVDRDSGQPSDAPTNIGDTTLIASIWRTLKAGNVCAELRYGLPQRSGGMDRRTWAQVLRRDIGAMLD